MGAFQGLDLSMCHRAVQVRYSITLRLHSLLEGWLNYNTLLFDFNILIDYVMFQNLYVM